MKKRTLLFGIALAMSLNLAAMTVRADSDSLFVDTNGNVGIGTDTPQEKLHVKDGGILFDRGFGGSAVNYTYGSRSYRYTFEGPAYNMLIKGRNSCPIMGIDRFNGNPDSPDALADNDKVFEIRTSGTNANGTQTYHSMVAASVDGSPDGDRLDQKLGLLDEKLVIRGSGNVGIGTSNPSKKLHLDGDLRVTKDIFMEGGTIQSSSRLHITGEELLFVLNKDGAIISKAWGGNGNLTVEGLINGVVVGSSDIRWKENIRPLDNALDQISQLRGVSFDWADTSRGTDRQVGVIAQEVEQVLPEIVHTDSQGYKSVEYAKLVAPLIEAVKVLKARSEQLEAENQNLKRRGDDLEARLLAIEARLAQ